MNDDDLRRMQEKFRAGFGGYTRTWAEAVRDSVDESKKPQVKASFAADSHTGAVEMKNGRRVVENKAQPLDDAQVLAAKKAYRQRYPEIDWNDGQMTLERVHQVTRIVQRDELADGEWIGRWYGCEVRVTIGEAQYSIEADGHGTGQEVLVVVVGHKVRAVRRTDKKGSIV